MTTGEIIFRAFLVGLLIAVSEIVQGILRVRFLNRRVGDHRARQIGVIIGCTVISGITWLSLPWMGSTTAPELVSVGLLWFTLMLGFDLTFGRLVFRFPWHRIAADFDPRRGNLLGFGMLFLLIAPLLVAILRGII